MKNRSRVFGVGINDLPYAVTRYEKVDGKEKQVWVCPFYACWKHMLRRVFNSNYINRNPTYLNTTLDTTWLHASNFKAWMEQQPWEGNQLDKDILLFGNKHYSPGTCVFVPAYVNSCLNTRNRDRGNYPLGVHLSSKRFQAQCEGSGRYLGTYSTPEEAHNAWKTAKVSQFMKILDKYSKEEYFDERVSAALLQRVRLLEKSILTGEEIKDL